MNGSGAALARAFHDEVVGPLLARSRPGLRYAAGRPAGLARLGCQMLGLDDHTSRDHDWGLRLTVLVDEADAGLLPELESQLTRDLPDEFAGLPVRVAFSGGRLVSHHVDLATVVDFARARTGVDATRELSTLDWARTHRRYVVACGWHRVSERMPLIGRTAQTGQPRPSRLLAASVVRDLTSLAFLLNRAWQPYDKWSEALFQRLPGADALGPLLDTAVGTDDWRRREDAVAAAVELLLARQRERGLPTPDDGVVPFFTRPYRTVNDEVPRRLLAGITDPELSALAVPAGGIEQWVDNVAVLSDAGRRAGLAAVYQTWLTRS